MDEMLTSNCGNSDEGLNKLGVVLTAPMEIWALDRFAVTLSNSSPFNSLFGRNPRNRPSYAV